MPKIDREERLRVLKATDEPFLSQGFVVAGIDEVGRGPLVGDVVTACVAMPATSHLLWVDDSKKLSEKRREALYEQIMAEALYVGIGRASAQVIDEINILQATKKAMREAAAQVPADVFLVDAVTGLGLNGTEIAIIHGDASSYAIAAASIVAKVTRDRQMIELDKRYPGYGFAKNKGYGTPEHVAALKALGPCPEHRRSFLRNIL